jgi:Domain of unknown function (DUF3943)
VPAAEALAFHFALLGFSNLITRQSFAAISADSIASHFDGRRPWTLDTDYFLTNQFGHPYQGNLAFTAARSSGLNFWWASLYPFFSSLAWEAFFEVDAPSINDQITTTLGGIFLGEVFFRSALMLLEGTPNPVQRVLSALLDPVGTANRRLFDGQYSASDVDLAPPFWGELEAGATVTSVLGLANIINVPLLRQGPQGQLYGEVIYGLPGNPAFRYRFPFSHFSISAGTSFPGVVSHANLYIRGLLVGGQLGNASGSLRGVWGVFGLYDFASNSYLRVSSVGLGLGTTFQWQLSRSVFLQGTFLAGGVPYGSAGDLGLDENVARNYHVGAGAQFIGELRLLHVNAGILKLQVRNWVLAGAYVEPLGGLEVITYVTPSLTVKLAEHFGVVLDLPIGTRRANFTGQTRDVRVGAAGIRIALAYFTDGSMGAVRAPLEEPRASGR